MASRTMHPTRRRHRTRVVWTTRNMPKELHDRILIYSHRWDFGVEEMFNVALAAGLEFFDYKVRGSELWEPEPWYDDNEMEDEAHCKSTSTTRP